MKYLIAYLICCLIVAIWQGATIGWIGSELRAQGANANPDWANLFYQALNPLGFWACQIVSRFYKWRNPAPIKAQPINLGRNN